MKLLGGELGVADRPRSDAPPSLHLSRFPAGPTLEIDHVQRVPPVLPDARVFCIGLNYLKHAAEGSYRDQELPAYPTLFARWTQSLTVDGAEVPVPSNEDGIDWEGEIVDWVGAPLVDASRRVERWHGEKALLPWQATRGFERIHGSVCVTGFSPCDAPAGDRHSTSA